MSLMDVFRLKKRLMSFASEVSRKRQQEGPAVTAFTKTLNKQWDILTCLAALLPGSDPSITQEVKMILDLKSFLVLVHNVCGKMIMFESEYDRYWSEESDRDITLDLNMIRQQISLPPASSLTLKKELQHEEHQAFLNLLKEAVQIVQKEWRSIQALVKAEIKPMEKDKIPGAFTIKLDDQEIMVRLSDVFTKKEWDAFQTQLRCMHDTDGVRGGAARYMLHGMIPVAAMQAFESGKKDVARMEYT